MKYSIMPMNVRRHELKRTVGDMCLMNCTIITNIKKLKKAASEAMIEKATENVNEERNQPN